MQCSSLRCYVTVILGVLSSIAVGGCLGFIGASIGTLQLSFKNLDEGLFNRTFALLAVVHVRQQRGAQIPVAVHILVGVLVLAAAGSTLFRTYLVGDSGARAAWGDVVSTVKSSGP
jgi:hypothetical protein